MILSQFILQFLFPPSFVTFFQLVTLVVIHVLALFCALIGKIFDTRCQLCRQIYTCTLTMSPFSRPGALISDPSKNHKWVAGKRRITLHFTPTYSSKLNQIDIWFEIFSPDVIRGGIWKSKQDWLIRSWTTSRATTSSGQNHSSGPTRENR